MIILPILTTSLIHFSLKIGRMYFLNLEMKGSIYEIKDGFLSLRRQITFGKNLQFCRHGVCSTDRLDKIMCAFYAGFFYNHRNNLIHTLNVGVIRRIILEQDASYAIYSDSRALLQMRSSGDKLWTNIVRATAKIQCGLPKQKPPNAYWKFQRPSIWASIAFEIIQSARMSQL